MIKPVVAFSFFLCLFLCFACGHDEESSVTIPENILNEEQFTALLTDFALAEGAAGMNVKQVPPAKFDSVYAFDPVSDNKVRRSQYDSTLAFYSLHPKLYKKIYENVLENLSRMQTSRNTQTATPGSK